MEASLKIGDQVLTLPVSEDKVKSVIEMLKGKAISLRKEAELCDALVKSVQACCSHPGRTWTDDMRGDGYYSTCKLCGL